MKVKFENYAYRENDAVAGFLIRHKDLLNIKGIAKKAGLSPSFLFRLMKSERRLTKETFDKLLPVLESVGFEY